MLLMRRLYLSLAMALMMLMSQQGVVWHEIGHLSGSSPAQLQKQKPIDKLCSGCLAFAHLAVSVKPEIQTPPALAGDHPLVAPQAVVSVAADAPRHRSRGPPLSL